MPKRHLSSPKTALAGTSVVVPVDALESHIRDWLFYGECEGHSRATLESRKIYTKNLVWFLRQREYPEVGHLELREFLSYVRAPDKNGKWGTSGRFTGGCKPSTVRSYYTNLSAFFAWLVKEELLDFSPMNRVPTPICRSQQIQPLNPEQVSALMFASERSEFAKRDIAIVTLLLDTGIRATELCQITVANLDIHNRRGTVVGKGNKKRAIYFGKQTARALFNHLRFDQPEDDEAVFRSYAGHTTGEALTRSGLAHIVGRLGDAAGMQAIRCSPHTLRHTFAVSFLRNGGNTFSLQQMLGHESLTMTRRYCALAEADLEKQHRDFSPVDRMGER